MVRIQDAIKDLVSNLLFSVNFAKTTIVSVSEVKGTRGDNDSTEDSPDLPGNSSVLLTLL